MNSYTIEQHQLLVPLVNYYKLFTGCLKMLGIFFLEFFNPAGSIN